MVALRQQLHDCGYPDGACDITLVSLYTSNLVTLWERLRESATAIFDHTPADDEWYFRVLPMAAVFAELHATTTLELANMPLQKETYRSYWLEYFGEGWGDHNWQTWSQIAVSSVRTQIDDAFNDFPEFTAEW